MIGISKKEEVLMMPKIHEKMMQTDFAKKLKKLIILTVCVVLLGGGVSTAMLSP